MKSNNLKLRWINYAGYELVLPNGKVIVIDPCIDIYNKIDSFTPEDYTGADYIILSHTHYDHTKDISYLEKKYNSKVIVGALSAKALATYFDIDIDHLYPVFPQEKYEFEDFTLHCFRAKHTFFNSLNNTLNGMMERTNSEDYLFPKEHIECDMFGSIEYMDYMITTKENYRIFISGGGAHWQTYTNIYQTMKDFRPNLLFRQSSSKYTPEQYGQMADDFGAQFVFPLHQDGILKKMPISIEEYMSRANSELAKIGSFTRVINPIQFKWYSIETSVTEC